MTSGNWDINGLKIIMILHNPFIQHHTKVIEQLKQAFQEQQQEFKNFKQTMEPTPTQNETLQGRGQGWYRKSNGRYQNSPGYYNQGYTIATIIIKQQVSEGVQIEDTIEDNVTTIVA